MSHDKVTRLMALLQVLLATRTPLTAREVRERVAGYSDDLEAFRRTFERDKKELGEMLGHPVRAEPVPGADPPIDGYRLRPEEAYLADPGLTQEERRALVLAASAVRLAGIDPTGGMTKLGAGAAEAGTEVAVPDRAAGRRGRRLALPGGGRAPSRHVHLPVGRAGGPPAAAALHQGPVVPDGVGHRAGGRAPVPARPAGGPGGPGGRGGLQPRPVRSHDALDEPWAMGDGPAVDVRVRVDRGRADGVRRTVPAASVEDVDDGAVVVTLGTRNVDALISFVLGFLDEAEVLSPPEVRSALLDRVRAAWSGRTVISPAGRRRWSGCSASWPRCCGSRSGTARWSPRRPPTSASPRRSCTATWTWPR